ncbi:sortase domain-bontaining protein [Frankia sp. Cj5]|uniref:sortase domain-containing protein n=2 Tax=Frankia TaxID=1854 RepID=UPI001EF59F0B|nr:sortase [Frankia sp. Cj5]
MRILTGHRSAGPGPVVAAALRRALALAVGLLLASALASTGRSNANAVPPAPASEAAAGAAGAHGYLRVVDASPGGTLRVTSPALPEAIQLEYKGVSEYKRVPAGTISMTAVRTGATPAAPAVTIPGGGSVSLIITGDAADLAVVPVQDSFTAPGVGPDASGLSSIRLINATTPDAADGKSREDLRFVLVAAPGRQTEVADPGQASAFVPIPATTTTVGLRHPGRQTDLLSIDDVALAPGAVGSVIVTGGSGDHLPAAFFTMDARGPAVVPTGPVRTGPNGLSAGLPERLSHGLSDGPPDGLVDAGLAAVLLGALLSGAVLSGAVPLTRGRRSGTAASAGVRGGIRRPATITTVVTAVALMLAGCGGSSSGKPPADGSIPTASAAGSTGDGRTGGNSNSQAQSQGSSDRNIPTALLLPQRLLADGHPQAAPVIPIGVLGPASPPDRWQALHSAAGELETLSNAAEVAWFSAGMAPGDIGPAVMTAHVEWDHKPGVFAKLDQMKTGDAVQVRRRDGSTVTFTVDRVDRYPKASPRDAELYRPSPGPELRLVTCTGGLDGEGLHLENLVVSLSLAR